MFIKDIILKFVGIYSKFNPLVYQNRYANKTLKAKSKTINFDKLDKNTKKNIRKIWGGVPESKWFKFYHTIGNKQNTHLYFPDSLFYKYVDSKLNNWVACQQIDDKGLYDLLFHDVNRPKTIAIQTGDLLVDDNYNIISTEELLAICNNYDKLIIKPTISSSGGKGILFVEKEDFKSLKKILKQYSNCIIQEVIEQHKILSDLHPSSINTIRIMTLTIDNEIRILSSVLRMGIGNSKVDNVSSGGIACGIDKDGKLKEKAFNANGICFMEHPQTGKFAGTMLPGYSKCVDICTKIAPRFSRFSKLISWDFSIDTNSNPILIEANLYGGELDFHQMCNGPIFGDYKESKKMIDKFVRGEKVY